MSISTTVGLISGIDSAALIDQLLAISARPKQLAQRRVVELQQQQAAFLDINSTLLALKTASAKFDRDDVFDAASASSSNSEVLSATASANAEVGSYSFLVDRLVSTQRSISRGFADRDVSAVGATRFTVERGGGGVRAETRLDELNGGQGVRRGVITVTDRAGGSAEIDLSRAVTVDDVLAKINAAAGVNVEASVSGDGIVITDRSGRGGNLTIADAFGSFTAEDLGLAQSVAADTLSSGALRRISAGTALSTLNDGLGVLIKDGTTDFTITTSSGDELSIDLGRKTQTVLTEDVTLNGTDYTAGTPIADIPDGDLPPQQIDADGDGDEDDPNPDYPATESRVTQARAATVGDVIDIINDAAANYDPDGDGVANPLDLTAGINAAGTGLVINDSTGGGGNLIIAEPVDGAGDPRPNRTTARDLGIVTSDTGVAPGSFEGRRLVAGINTVLVSNLNGGSGLTATDLEITDRSGVTTNVTVDAALFGGSLNELVEAVNADLAAAGNAVRLGVNNAGNGLRVTDESGASGNLVVSGGLADELGLAVDAATSTSEGESLQMRWIGEATRLDSLNAGRGIGTGTFRITDASGTSLEYRVTSSLSTVEDLVSFINSRPNNNIEARVNDNGDGILITDTSGGAGQLVIEDEEGSVARNLNLVGEYEVDGVTGEAAADGSFERVIEFNDTDTLDDVVRTFNEAGVGVTASIVNDGAPGTPYRINFTSRDSGSEGRFILDTAGLDLGLSTISEGDDAVVFFGSDDPATAVLLTSSTNTLDDVVRGVSIDLKQASSDPVELTVQRDTGAIEEAMTEFVDAFNGVLDTLDQYDNYNAETERASLLLGDGTIQQIRSQLYRVIQQPAQNVDSRYRFLFEVGVRIGDGARLTFDSGDFREALEQDFESVRNVVAAFELAPREPVEIVPGVTVQPEEDNVRSSGVAELVEALADGFTNSIDGLLTRKDDQLDTQIDLQEDRIGRFDEQLARERARLERQFVAMEQALAQLQTQQQALGQLSG